MTKNKWLHGAAKATPLQNFVISIFPQPESCATSEHFAIQLFSNWLGTT
jgi:hypothetical protein